MDGFVFLKLVFKKNGRVFGKDFRWVLAGEDDEGATVL